MSRKWRACASAKPASHLGSRRCNSGAIIGLFIEDTVRNVRSSTYSRPLPPPLSLSLFLFAKQRAAKLRSNNYRKYIIIRGIELVKIYINDASMYRSFFLFAFCAGPPPPPPPPPPRDSHVHTLALLIAISGFDYALNSRSRKTGRGRLPRRQTLRLRRANQPFCRGGNGIFSRRFYSARKLPVAKSKERVAA